MWAFSNASERIKLFTVPQENDLEVTVLKNCWDSFVRFLFPWISMVHSQERKDIRNSQNEIRKNWHVSQYLQIPMNEWQWPQSQPPSSQEEVEEISFVPSAISVPPKFMFQYDNQCSEKTFNFWQLASAVEKDGEESYTTNSCQQCYNDTLVAEGERQLKRWQRFWVCAEKGASWKVMENSAKNSTTREM